MCGWVRPLIKCIATTTWHSGECALNTGIDSITQYRNVWRMCTLDKHAINRTAEFQCHSNLASIRFWVCAAILLIELCGNMICEQRKMHGSRRQHEIVDTAKWKRPTFLVKSMTGRHTHATSERSVMFTNRAIACKKRHLPCSACNMASMQPVNVCERNATIQNGRSADTRWNSLARRNRQTKIIFS